MKTVLGYLYLIIGLILVSIGLFQLNQYNKVTESANKSVDLVYKELKNEIETEVSIPKTFGNKIAENWVEPINIHKASYSIEKKEMLISMVNGIKYVGILEIPSLSISLSVINEYSEDNLNISVNRYKGSIYSNDLIIVGHNYKKHFSPLKNIELGAKIYFMDVEGQTHIYEVCQIEIINGYDVDKMESGEWDMTLFTCTTGGASRFTVRCIRV